MIKGKVEIITELCKSCGYCIKYCPQGVLKNSGHVNTKGYEYVNAVNDNCIACCSCARICPAGAINVYRAKKEV